jgi:hypothetical protein
VDRGFELFELRDKRAHLSRDSSQRLVPRLDMDVRSANSAKSNSNALFAGRAKRPDSCALYNLLVPTHSAASMCSVYAA